MYIVKKNNNILSPFTGWSGQFCDESNIDECRTAPCNATQKCINTLSGYECVCPDGFTGIIT